jgi:hypothetical protein
VDVRTYNWVGAAGALAMVIFFAWSLIKGDPPPGALGIGLLILMSAGIVAVIAERRRR